MVATKGKLPVDPIDLEKEPILGLGTYYFPSAARSRFKHERTLRDHAEFQGMVISPPKPSSRLEGSCYCGIEFRYDRAETLQIKYYFRYSD